MKPEERKELVREYTFYAAKVEHENLKMEAIQVMLDTSDEAPGASSVIGEAYRKSLESELRSCKSECGRVLARRNIAERMLDL